MPQFASKVWQRVRTPYGSFVATTAAVALLMGCAGDHVALAGLSFLLLIAWCYYVLAFHVVRGPGREIRHRAVEFASNVFVVTACVAIIVGAMVHRWPLQWRFTTSRAALDRFADRVENGLQISKPQAVGWFMIERAEMRKGVPCLWTAPDLAGSTGLRSLHAGSGGVVQSLEQCAIERPLAVHQRRLNLTAKTQTRFFSMFPMLLLAAALSADPGDDQIELLKTFRDEFIPVTPGEGKFPAAFTMGDDGGPQAERPAHRVQIKHRFEIARYEVPQNLWEAVMGENPSRWKGPRNSVEMLSFDDAQAFCRKATELMRRRQTDQGQRGDPPAERSRVGIHRPGRHENSLLVRGRRQAA